MMAALLPCGNRCETTGVIPISRLSKMGAKMGAALCAAAVWLSPAAAEVSVGTGAVEAVPGLHSKAAVERFYRETGGQAVWTANGGALLAKLGAALAGAAGHGLEPADYHAARLADYHAGRLAKDSGAAEVLATDAYLTYGAHLLRGKVGPVTVEPDWTAAARAGDAIAALKGALASGDVTESLEALAPSAPSYRALQAALIEWRRKAESEAAGRPPAKLPAGPSLKPGAKGARVSALQTRLAAGGFLGGDFTNGTYDAATEAAVGAFQRAIGLEADGIAGQATVRELNRTAADRVATLKANLERWRWLAEDLGRRHIRVNIPEFALQGWEDGRPVVGHDVIVGRTYRKTPVFSGEMSYLVFNPWWETPPSIARNDKLPAFREDPGMVERLGFEVLDRSGRQVDPATVDWRKIDAQDFPYRLRQQPGPQNALGQVKMMFPNPHNVYLHDTPSRELFARSRRDFSSGCIRVHRAIELSAWVLQATPGWDRARIDRIVADGKETTVSLAKKLPVHVMYMTAVRGADGKVRFLDDIYDRDSRLIKALGIRSGQG